MCEEPRPKNPEKLVHVVSFDRPLGGFGLVCTACGHVRPLLPGDTRVFAELGAKACPVCEAPLCVGCKDLLIVFMIAGMRAPSLRFAGGWCAIASCSKMTILDMRPDAARGPARVHVVDRAPGVKPIVLVCDGCGQGQVPLWGESPRCTACDAGLCAGCERLCPTMPAAESAMKGATT